MKNYVLNKINVDVLLPILLLLTVLKWTKILFEMDPENVTINFFMKKKLDLMSQRSSNVKIFASVRSTALVHDWGKENLSVTDIGGRTCSVRTKAAVKSVR